METVIGIELVVDCAVDDFIELGSLPDVSDDILAKDGVVIGDFVVGCELVVISVVLIVVAVFDVSLVNVPGIHGTFLVVGMVCEVDKRGKFDVDDEEDVEDNVCVCVPDILNSRKRFISNCNSLTMLIIWLISIFKPSYLICIPLQSQQSLHVFLVDSRAVIRSSWLSIL